MDAKKRWQEAQQFLKDATSEHTHIFHDSDADGIGAGLLLVHALTDLGVPVSSTTRANREDILSREELELVKSSYDPQRIIVVDLNPKDYGAYKDLRELFTTAEFLILDHHRVTEYADAVFLHPEELFGIDGAKYCSAKLALDLASSVGEVADYEWLAAVGINGDRNTEYFSDVIIRSLEHEGFPVPTDLSKGETAVVNEAILCCSAVGDAALYDYVTALKGARTLREAALLDNPHPEVRSYVEELVEQSSSALASGERVNWVFIDSELSVTGWVGNVLSAQRPGEVFVLYREKKGGYSMSFRCQDSVVHCGEVADTCASRHGGAGGGHRPAAGAWVPKEEFSAYKACVQEAVKQAFSDLDA